MTAITPEWLYKIAAEVEKDPTRWSQDVAARDKEGAPTLPKSESACSGYLVWKQEYNRSDARRIEAFDAEDAAEIYGRDSDTNSAEYWIVRGGEQRVWVELDEPGAEPELFEVTGESVPTYYASRVQP